MKLKHLAFAGLAVAGLAAGSVALAAPADAASFDGICNNSAYPGDGNGDFCLYYSPNLGNSLWDRSNESGQDANLGDNYFISPGAGQGQVVRNNAASANDRYYGESVWVYYSPNYMGSIGPVFVGSLQAVNDLGVLRNNEASYRWTE